MEALPMWIARLLFAGSAVIVMMSAVGTAQIARATEVIMLRAGEATGPNVVFAFQKDAKPHSIVVRTNQSGVAGSRLDLTIDKAKKAVFSHIFTAEECKFGDGGSKCETVIPASNAAYGMVINRFKLGRVAHLTVMDAGVMKMDQTVSLNGFAKSLRN
jgi:hypothetical protein